jgi:beta-glucosidase
MRGRTYKYMEGNIYFPFGFGLSYGHVGYSDLKVNADKKQGASVTFTLQNDSKCDVVETPQVYVSAPGAGTTAPLQQLAAFRRVEVKAGERITITIDVPVERLMTVQADGTRKLVKGEYTLLVGSAAPSPRSSVLGVSCVSAKVKL